MIEATYTLPSLRTQGNSQTELPLWPWACYLEPSHNLPCSPAPKGNPFRGNLSGIVFPGSSDGKESACNVEDPSSIPGLERFPREGNGYPLQYSCPENSRDRGAWLQSMGSQRVRHDCVTNPFMVLRNQGNTAFRDGACNQLYQLYQLLLRSQ